MPKIIVVNASDKSWAKTNALFAFGAYGELRLLAYGRSVEDCLDACIDWIAEHAPGLLMNEQVEEHYEQLKKDFPLLAEDALYARATADMFCGGNCDFIANWELQIIGEALLPHEIAYYHHAEAREKAMGR